ncbi:MAG: adenylate kinase [Bifidobacteriaceae bacterium]|jgi:adenylate kinase|nr:adenylate kinase [Bifidobacteriaceae bacterium]
MNLIIFGPQGVGKGTQSKLLAKHYGLKHISTGEAFRESISEGSKLGKGVEQFIKQGEFVPDELVNAIVAEELAKNDKGWILDGYPRNLPQVEYLDKTLAKLDQKIDFVIVLSAPHQILKERMLSRREIENRSDDVEKIIERRLQLFAEKTEPVLGYYNKLKLVRVLNGVGTIEEVNRYIISNVENFLKNVSVSE